MTVSGIPAVGATARRSRTLSHADIACFTEMTGDRNPLHYDAGAAARSRFGGIIVQGGVTSGLLNAVVAEDLPGPGTVFLQVDWSFKAPGRPGQTITAEVEVLQRRDDKPIGTLRTTVTDAAGTVLLDGTAVVYREPLPLPRSDHLAPPGADLGLERVDPRCLGAGQAAVLLAGAPWRRLAVIGDSLAEGLGDPVTGYRDASWSERLAAGLRAAVGPITELNLGLRNLTAAEILETQLAPALRFGPDLVVVTAGANDLLRPSYAPAAVAADLDSIVGSLARRGAVVVTFGLFDLSRTGLVTALPPRELHRRTTELNAVTRAVTARHHGVHVDFSGRQAAADGLLSADHLHPNRRGHAQIASELVRALAGHRSTPAAGDFRAGHRPGGMAASGGCRSASCSPTTRPWCGGACAGSSARRPT